MELLDIEFIQNGEMYHIQDDENHNVVELFKIKVGVR